MRMMPVWSSVAEQTPGVQRILQDIMPSSVPDTDRWRTAVAKILLVRMMVIIPVKMSQASFNIKLLTNIAYIGGAMKKL